MTTIFEYLNTNLLLLEANRRRGFEGKREEREEREERTKS
jgi:hypothetical protein